MDEPPHDAGRHCGCRRICLRTEQARFDELWRLDAPTGEPAGGRRECTPGRVGQQARQLALKRQQRRLQQVFVRIVERDPAIELGSAPTDDDQPIAAHRRRPGIGMAGTRARTVRQDEAAQVSIDTGHHVASWNGTNVRDHGPLSALTLASLASTSAIRFCARWIATLAAGAAPYPRAEPATPLATLAQGIAGRW